MKKTVLMLGAVLGAGILCAEMTEQEIGKQYGAARQNIQKGNIEEARTAIEALIKESKQDNTKREMSVTLAKLALSENKLDDASKAVAAAKTFTDLIHPNTTAATAIIDGRVLAAQKKYEEADQAFKSVISTSYNHSLFKSEAQCYLAEMLYTQGKKAEALEAFKAVQPYPNQWDEVKKLTADRIAELSK